MHHPLRKDLAGKWEWRVGSDSGCGEVGRTLIGVYKGVEGGTQKRLMMEVLPVVPKSQLHHC